MRHAMLNVEATAKLVIPPFFILKYTNMPITQYFLLILVIMALEMSIAYPGSQNAWVILFAALMLPEK